MVRSTFAHEDSDVLAYLAYGDVVKCTGWQRSEKLVRFCVQDGFVDSVTQDEAGEKTLQIMVHYPQEPIKYIVTREQGATIRQEKYFDSPEIALCPCHTIVEVSEKHYMVKEKTMRLKITHPVAYAGWGSDKREIFKNLVEYSKNVEKISSFQKFSIFFRFVNSFPISSNDLKSKEIEVIKLQLQKMKQPVSIKSVSSLEAPPPLITASEGSATYIVDPPQPTIKLSTTCSTSNIVNLPAVSLSSVSSAAPSASIIISERITPALTTPSLPVVSTRIMAPYTYDLSDAHTDSLRTYGVQFILKVVHSSGAVVRDSRDIDSGTIVRTIPPGEIVQSLCSVTTSSGLLRYEVCDGYISAVTRGEAGERIVSILVHCPTQHLMFVVMHEKGITIRAEHSFKSPIASQCPCDTVLEVSERRYSELNQTMRLKIVSPPEFVGWCSETSKDKVMVKMLSTLPTGAKKNTEGGQVVIKNTGLIERLHSKLFPFRTNAATQ